MFNDLINDAFVSMLTVAVPTVSGLALRAFGKFVAQITSERIGNEIADRLEDAVYATGQTYVDDLKKNGAFTKEAQAHALGMALATLLGSLSQEAKDYIQENFGNTETYLTGRIEAEVNRQKMAA